MSESLCERLLYFKLGLMVMTAEYCFAVADTVTKGARAIIKEKMGEVREKQRCETKKFLKEVLDDVGVATKEDIARLEAKIDQLKNK